MHVPTSHVGNKPWMGHGWGSHGGTWKMGGWG